MIIISITAYLCRHPNKSHASLSIAEQAEPMRRRVALMAVKLRMDTKQVVVWFEAEWQALAMTDHPTSPGRSMRKRRRLHPVAQVANLPYRRLPVGRVPPERKRRYHRKLRRLAALRCSRLAVCATQPRSPLAALPRERTGAAQCSNRELDDVGLRGSFKTSPAEGSGPTNMEFGPISCRPRALTRRSRRF